MYKRKLAIGLLCAAIATVGVVAVAGCGDKPTDEHEHTFATDWLKDEANHWHAATCEHEDEKSDLGAHAYTNFTDNGDGTCTGTCVCGATKTSAHQKPESYTTTAQGHSFNCVNCGITISGEHDANGFYITETSHVVACSVCGYFDSSVQLEAHNYTTSVEKTDHTPAREVQAKTCEDDSTKHQKICLVCGHTVGEAAAHDLVYIYENGDYYTHDVYCTGCDYTKLEEAHILEMEEDGVTPKVYWSDEASYMGLHGYHQNYCVACQEVCNGKIHITEGKDAFQQDATCSYRDNQDGTHSLVCSGCPLNVVTLCSGKTYGKDDIYHWNICDKCESVISKVRHNYVWNESEGTCATCGKTITHTAADHIWSEDFADDGTNHYTYCLICDAVKENSSAPHTESTSATKFHNGKHYTECTGCHKPMTLDENSAHSFVNGKCEICGASKYLINLKTTNGAALTTLNNFKLYNGNIEITDCGITQNNGVVTVVFVPETDVLTYKLYHGAFVAGYCVYVDGFNDVDTNYYEFGNIAQIDYEIEITFAPKVGMKDNPYNLDIVTSNGEVDDLGQLKTTDYTKEVWLKINVTTEGGNFKLLHNDPYGNLYNNGTLTVYRQDKTTTVGEIITITSNTTSFTLDAEGVYYLKLAVTKDCEAAIMLYRYFAPLENFTPTTVDSPEEATLTDSNKTASFTVVNNYKGTGTNYDYIKVTMNTAVGGRVTVSLGEGAIGGSSRYSLCFPQIML